MARILWMVLLVLFSLPAQGQAGQRQEDIKPVRLSDLTRFVEANRNYFVQLEIRLAEKKGKKDSPYSLSFSVGDSLIEQYSRQTLVRSGIVFSEDGLILMEEMGEFTPEHFSSIVVVTPQQKRWPARYFGRLSDYPGDLLKIEEGNLTPPRLENYDIAVPGNEYYMLYLENRENRLYFQGREGSLESSIPFDPACKDIIPSDTYPMSLLLTPEGKPFGIYLGIHWVEKGKRPWITADDIPRVITAEKLINMNQEAAARLRDTIYPVIVHFRLEKMDEEDIYYMYEEECITSHTIEVKASACLMDEEGNLLIPMDIPQKHARRITEILVCRGEQRFPAAFRGIFRDFGAVLIHCEDLRGIQGKVDRSFMPQRGELFYSVAFGQDSDPPRADVATVRYFRKEFGYKDREMIVIFPEPASPYAFFMNRDFAVIGFYTNSKMDKEDTLRLAESGGDRWEKNKFFLFASLDECLRSPAAFFDPESVPQEKKKADQNLWLGVDLQPVDKNMIEYLRANDATESGTCGVMIRHVYKNSPAEKIGLKPLDIILSIATEDTKTEIFMKTEHASAARRYYEEVYNPGVGFYRFFPHRRNLLEDLLKQLGEGRTVVLKYFSKGEIRTAHLTLEKAPMEFDTAEQVRDEFLGLAVKDVTYEIRDVLRVGDDYTGAVIAEVSSGKPASIAGLEIYEIIEAVNGVRVQGSQHFQSLLETARTGGQREITLVVKQLDRGRIVILPTQ